MTNRRKGTKSLVIRSMIYFPIPQQNIPRGHGALREVVLNLSLSYLAGKPR